MYISILLFISLIFLFLFIHNKKNKENKENFIDFSPYILNNEYNFEYLKKKDREALQKKIQEWETPFNGHNEGYYNLGLTGTPLVPL